MPPSPKDCVTLHGQFEEFIKACQDLEWKHGAMPPHHSEINGIVERAVRKAKEETGTAMVHSGVSEEWWTCAMNVIATCETYTSSWPMARQRMRKSLWFHSDGPVIPLATNICDKPISSEDESRLHQFGEICLIGLFVGCVLHVGGG